jgi:hypothetical protein
MIVWLIIAGLIVGSYFLFRDTMNKIQYVQTLRLYWITRNVGGKGVPLVSAAFMRQTAEPWWQGRGVQFRIGKYTFQIGILLRKADGLLDQVGGRDMDADPKEIRSW